MRDIILLCEGLFDDLPAEKAVQEVYSLRDDSLGVLVVDTLAYKSSHPDHFDWPIDGDDIVVLERIEASKKGKGYGKKMLNFLCKVCDKYNVKIYLDASPYSTGLSYGALIAFYTKAGFKPFPEMKEFAAYPMIRLPKRPRKPKKDAMRINEIQTPMNRNEAVKTLLQAGYEMLGQPGRNGIVLRKPSAGYCVKLFATMDTAYLSYLKLVQSRSNPHFPRIKGKLVAIKEPKMDSNDPEILLAMLMQMDIQDPGVETTNGRIVFYGVRLEILEENYDEALKWTTAIQNYLAGDKSLAESQPLLAKAVNLIKRLRKVRPDYAPRNILFRGNVPVLIDPVI